MFFRLGFWKIKVLSTHEFLEKSGKPRLGKCWGPCKQNYVMYLERKEKKNNLSFKLIYFLHIPLSFEFLFSLCVCCALPPFQDNLTTAPAKSPCRPQRMGDGTFLKSPF